MMFCIFIAASAMGQTLTTTVQKAFSVNGTTKDQHSFKEGDAVTVFAYKKKGSRYYFMVETKDYANHFNMTYIPFATDEKALKKLPNALSNEMEEALKQKQQDIVKRKKIQRKQNALNGSIRAVVSNLYAFYSEDDAIGKVNSGDTIYVVGFSKKPSDSYYHFALYSDKAAGIFKTLRLSAFKYDIDLDYLPSIGDADVKTFIDQKKKELKQIQDEKAAQFRKDVLKGNIKGKLYLAYLKTEDYKKSPFAYGDTVSIVGHTEKSYIHYYALFSTKGAGVFQTTSSIEMTFKDAGKIQFAKLPPVNDPEVQQVLNKQQIIADSLKAVQDSLLIEDFKKTANDLIEIYKKKSPVIVTVDSWSSNSAGGIEVELSVTNCSTQTIKYISFQGYFNNAVGDRCYNEIGGGSVWKARGVGPIGPRPTTTDDFSEKFDECRASYDFDNLTFYSRTADTFHLSSVTIQYTNGKTVTLSGSNLQNHVVYK